MRKPAVEVADEDRGSMHRRIRGEYIAQDMQRYAPHTLEDLYVQEYSSAPALGLAWAKAHGSQKDVDSYVRDILHRFWRLHEDVDSIVSVESVLKHTGLATEGFSGIRWRGGFWLTWSRHQLTLKI